MKSSTNNLFNDNDDFSFFIIPSIVIGQQNGIAGILFTWLNFAWLIEWEQ